MDDELQQLEAELSRLQPVAPRRELVSRVERELGRPVTRRALAHVHWLWAAALPVAAAAAVFAMVFTQSARDRASTAPPMASSAITSLKPVAAENLLVSARDEGLVTLADGTPARRERLQFVDTITWRNPRTNASLTWSVPREEVRVVPVSFH